ncbi:NHLP bacteriocin system secretion protein [Salinarimonas ramus]|uniref:NHLP bacteriocin system secretion protein n=1 Tax=Salinarimonas ramus TaxID=690164 RepID=A0A917QG11_9HYPH|nr:NHLP bacteriocin system secretion protein [Salinarimonas ramus]GGK48814.1 hypothetical protein GCM10011322_39820 [Salinarimonas ramus]
MAQSSEASLPGPERLQTAIRITDPGSWIIAAVFVFVTIAVIVWGVLGVLTTRVGGLGIVLAQDGAVYELRSVGDGTVVELAVDIGASVTEGQIVARIGQPGDAVRIEAANQQIQRLQDTYDVRSAQVRVDLAERRSATDRHIAVIEDRKRTLQQRVDYLADLLAVVERERREGLTTEARLQQVRADLADTRLQVNESDVEVAQANLEYLEFEDQRQDELDALRREIAQATADRDILERTHSERTNVVAGRAGRVIGLSARQGDVVSVGAPVARIDAEGDELRVVAFFEAADGKKIGPGMDVAVSPSTAERAIWGTIQGTVTRVSELPETLASVTSLLGNQQMAEQVFASGPPILVEVTMKADASTPSGLAWSSGEGPPYAITHGTMSAVSVVVREEAPANLVIPVFRSWVGHGT